MNICTADLILFKEKLWKAREKSITTIGEAIKNTTMFILNYILHFLIAFSYKYLVIPKVIQQRHLAKMFVRMNIWIYSECNKQGKQISEYIRNAKICWMNIRIYSEKRKETNIYKYEYIRLNIFEYILMSEYLLHTALDLSQI